LDGVNEVKPSGISYIPKDESSPEKAGVGGSIPSLATTLIIRHLLPFSSPQKIA